MMNRLLPDQVSALWGMLEPAIAMSIPQAVADAENGMTNILASMITGKMDCWIMYDRDEEGEVTLHAILTTAVWEDGLSGARNLLLYSFYGFTKELSEDRWKEALRIIKQWAISEKCSYIVAYTTLPKIVHLVKRLGGDVSTVFMMVPAMAPPLSINFT